ncbi:hypothetical protein DH2020_037414 [Rehmannia glutinosa]|uniref:Uncharacterized protein n=1 Tax=Rehmannia glutinosa TaxID=99300 RepID=A0ABR0V295_REHGL
MILNGLKKPTRFLLRCCSENMHAENWSPYGNNEIAITIAMKEVNKQIGKRVQLDSCVAPCNVLAKRHRVFSWLIRKHGVRYDPVSNRIYALDRIWDEMVEWDDFSLAYQYYGDPEWPALYQLFNTDDAPYKFNNIDAVDVSSDEGDEKEVIEIVDDSLSNDKTDGGKLPKTSPIREPTKVRCGSFNSLDRDLYHLLEQYPYSDSGSSEPSVNQPLPQSSSKKLSVKPLAKNPTRRTRFPRMPPPSPAKSIETVGSTFP